MHISETFIVGMLHRKDRKKVTCNLLHWFLNSFYQLAENLVYAEFNVERRVHEAITESYQCKKMDPQYVLFPMLLIPQILAESLPVKHILFISFEIHCSGAKKMCRCPNIYGPDCKIESS